MKKEKIHIEYILDAASKNIIWGAISTPTGLENWFADRVKVEDKIYTFAWGKTETRQAELINIRVYSFIRFRWLDEEDPKAYFEIRMIHNELTGEHILEIIDFVEPNEMEDQKKLWNSEIETLKRTCGV